MADKGSIWPMVAVIVASIAALAGTVQAYVSWNNRDVQFRAVALSQIVEQCGSALTDAQNTSFGARNLAAIFENKLDSTSASQKTLDDASKLFGSLVRLRLILAADDSGVSSFTAQALELDTLYKDPATHGTGNVFDSKSGMDLANTIGRLSQKLHDICSSLVRAKISK